MYTILGPDGQTTAYTWPGAPEVTHNGAGEFTLNLSPPALPGPYAYDVDATGAVVASRAGGFTVLANPATGTDVPWAVAGPCTPWVSAQDVWNCCGQPTVTIDGVECNVDFTAYAMASSQILFELSGRRFAGQCSKTVRPCAEDNWCGVQVLSRGHLVNWTGSFWWNGTTRSCGCQPLSRVLLSGYPVRGVTEVKIDGDVVDPTTYRLDERRYLTRVRASANDDVNLWPFCQMLDLPDTEDGTFSITYDYGMDPPLVGLDAAQELGCELYKACTNSGHCALPSGVTRVSRQGITVEKAALTAWGLTDGSWKTGLHRVDAFLNAYNPSRAPRRPSTWSPDGLKYARQVGQ